MNVFDLPSDRNGTLVNIRKPLVNAVNSARHSKTRCELLKQHLVIALAELEKFSESTEEAPVASPDEAPEVPRPKQKRATAKVNKDEVKD